MQFFEQVVLVDKYVNHNQIEKKFLTRSKELRGVMVRILSRGINKQLSR